MSEKAGLCRISPTEEHGEHRSFITIRLISGLFIQYFYPHQRITFGVGTLLLITYCIWLFRCKERIDYIRAGRFLWVIMIGMFLLATYFTFM